jgi:hypothetical protein
LPGLEIVDRLHRLVPNAAGGDFRIEAAQPVELARIEPAAFRIDQRLDGVDRVGHADGEPIARRHGGEIAGGLQRAGARHVLDDDVRLARHVPPHVLGEQPQIKPEGRARWIADHRLDGLAAIERGGVLGLRRASGEQRRDRGCGGETVPYRAHRGLTAA